MEPYKGTFNRNGSPISNVKATLLLYSVSRSVFSSASCLDDFPPIHLNFHRKIYEQLSSSPYPQPPLTEVSAKAPIQAHQLTLQPPPIETHLKLEEHEKKRPVGTIKIRMKERKKLRTSCALLELGTTEPIDLGRI